MVDCPEEYGLCEKCYKLDEWFTEPILEDGKEFRKEEYFVTLTECQSCKRSHHYVIAKGLCFDPEGEDTHAPYPADHPLAHT
jgi:hypothetical protein